jgi:hypothetical protein
MNVRKRMRSLGEGCGGRDICMLQLTVQVYREAWRSVRCQTHHYGEGGENVRHFFPFNTLISFTSSGNG